jgi:hypothetical protein
MQGWGAFCVTHQKIGRQTDRQADRQTDATAWRSQSHRAPTPAPKPPSKVAAWLACHPGLSIRYMSGTRRAPSIASCDPHPARLACPPPTVYYQAASACSHLAHQACPPPAARSRCRTNPRGTCRSRGSTRRGRRTGWHTSFGTVDRRLGRQSHRDSTCTCSQRRCLWLYAHYIGGLIP